MKYSGNMRGTIDPSPHLLEEGFQCQETQVLHLSVVMVTPRKQAVVDILVVFSEEFAEMRGMSSKQAKTSTRDIEPAQRDLK